MLTTLDNCGILFGLVFMSIYFVAKRVKQWNTSRYASFVIGAAIAFFITTLPAQPESDALWYIFLSGMIAICAMILPGISGSFVLVLLGKYHFILNAVGRFDILVLSVFTAGTATGIMLFVRLLNWLLKRYYQITMAALTGLMIGSLRKIWPWKSLTALAAGDSGNKAILVNILPQQLNTEVLVALGLALLGGLMVLLLQRLAEQ